jgi:hypothetical protein
MGPVKVSTHLFTTVWILVGPAGGTAMKLLYMVKYPAASIALP